MVSPNVPLFEHIAKRADEMYAQAVDVLLELRRAGHTHRANKQEETVQAYLAYRRSAHRNLTKALNRRAVAA